MDTDDPEELIHCYAGMVISEATGGDSTCGERFHYMESISKDAVLNLLIDAGVPVGAEIVEEDVHRAFEAEEPRYFLPPERIAELYRMRHGIAYSDQMGWVNQPNTVADEIIKCNLEAEKSGVTLSQYRDGTVCKAEQEFFYKTEEWNDRARVIRVLDRFKCRGCGQNRTDCEVHHDEHLYTAYCPSFYRNFDSDRLRSLCKPCHKAFHESRVRGHSHFVPANSALRRKDSFLWAKRAKLHDQLRECPYCFGIKPGDTVEMQRMPPIRHLSEVLGDFGRFPHKR